jgi:hypothetical protein
MILLLTLVKSSALFVIISFELNTGCLKQSVYTASHIRDSDSLTEL